MDNFKNIPEELKVLTRWVNWRLEVKEDGKPTKIPYNPSTGNKAQTTNPKTWGTFTEAVAGIGKYNFTGIGFVFNGDGIMGVDVDHCIDEEGRMSDIARDILHTLDSYTEYSQSGKGIHILCRGLLPGEEKKNSKLDVEMYSTERYFCMTGNILDDGHVDIEQRDEELAVIHARYLKKEKKQEQQFIYKPNSFSEDEIISKAMNSKHGGEFSALMNGIWKGRYSSQSDADFGLCRRLYFWLGDPAAIDRVFRQSGLMREKWNRRYSDGSTYGSRTIQNAMALGGQVYDHNYKSGRQKKTYEDPPEEDVGIDELIAAADLELPKWITGPYNDTWNAERFVDYCGKDIKYNHNKDSWLIWDGKRWEEDLHDSIRVKTNHAIDSLYNYKDLMYNKYATDSKKQKIYNEFVSWISKSKNTGRRNNMITESKSWPGISSISEEFDQDQWAFNCRNGTIDLKTGNISPHDREKMISKIAPVEYDPHEKAPKWDEFLMKIFDGNQAVIDFMQRAIGYSLTGSIREQSMFVCHGSGANGKSTMMGIVQDLMGDYARNTNFTTFTMKNDSNTNDIARLVGTRMVAAMEVGENKWLNTALIKQLTGGDRISARFLHQEFFDFIPEFKIWMGVNHKPGVTETDHGTWRRIKLIPFLVTIPENERDGDLPKKLKRELTGILNWAIEGCLKWQVEGLNPPQEVCAAVEEYRSEMDTLQSFIDECIIMANDSVRIADVYDVYSTWCKDNGIRNPWSKNKLGLKLKEKGFQSDRSMANRYWNNIKLSEVGKQILYRKLEGRRQNESDAEQEYLPWDKL